MPQKIENRELPENASVQELLAALRMLAEQAGKVVLEYYAQGDAVEVRDKDDSSPVTAADEACEAFILDALRQLTPNIPIISEEAASAGDLPDVVRDGAFWLVDPLDGTKEFLSRNGEFTVNIALVERAGRLLVSCMPRPGSNRSARSAMARPLPSTPRRVEIWKKFAPARCQQKEPPS